MTLGEERRAKLVMDLKNLKKEAPEYDVFISRTNRLDIEPYAVVSTGKSILEKAFFSYSLQSAQQGICRYMSICQAQRTVPAA